MLKKLLGSGVAVAGLVLSVPAFATTSTAVDFSSLTSAVNFSSTTTAILAVFAALAGVAIAYKGGKIILRSLGM